MPTAASRGTNALSDQQFQQVMLTLTEYAIFVLDPQGQVLQCNDGVQQLYGYSEKEIVGKHFSSLFTSQDICLDLYGMELTMLGAEGNSDLEHWQVRQFDNCFWGRGVTTPIGDGPVTGYIKVVQDWTKIYAGTQRDASTSDETTSRQTRLTWKNSTARKTSLWPFFAMNSATH